MRLFVDSSRNTKKLLLSWFLLLLAPSFSLEQDVLGVTPTLCDQGDSSCDPVLIEPTTVPTYVGCIKDVGQDCVNGNGVRAQAPFDPSTACPTEPIFGESGFLVDHKTVENQVRPSNVQVYYWKNLSAMSLRGLTFDLRC